MSSIIRPSFGLRTSARTIDIVHADLFSKIQTYHDVLAFIGARIDERIGLHADQPKFAYSEGRTISPDRKQIAVESQMRCTRHVRFGS